MQVSVLVGVQVPGALQHRPVHDAVLAGMGVPPEETWWGAVGRDTKGPTGGSLGLRHQGELPAGGSS